jgi:hypothetical protein
VQKATTLIENPEVLAMRESLKEAIQACKDNGVSNSLVSKFETGLEPFKDA